MKKISGCVLVAVFLFPVFIFAQEIKPDEWKNEILLNELWSEVYYLGLDNYSRYCYIYVSAGDGKIKIRATDLDFYGKKVEQDITIDPTTHKVEGYMQELDEKSGQPVPETGSGYDVFSEHFKGHALKLPSDIRSKFDGMWGIK